MILIDAFIDLLDLFNRSDTPMAAYRAAWKRRHREGVNDAELLVRELKQRSVPGAYDSYDSGRMAPLLALWARDVSPRQARQEFKQLKRR